MLMSVMKEPQVGIADLNQDILYLIFKFFDFPLGSSRDSWETKTRNRRSLLSAAKTCKAFSEPALNSLWHVLPSLLPLLLLLPSAEIVDNEYFVDNLSPSDNWERFEIHARRVRTLYLEANRVVISPIIYLRIHDLCGNLLPALKAIYIPDYSMDLFPVISLVSKASLDVVELDQSATSARSFFIPFMSSLSSNSPKLAHLALRGSANISLEPVYCLTNLQRLRLSGIYLYPHNVRRLGDLVNLLDLTLDVGTSIPAPDIDQRLAISSPSTSRNFGKLRRLHIIGNPISITRVLDDMNIASLTTLVIDEAPDTSGGHTESFWKRCFDQVSVCRAIEDIEINQHKSRRWCDDYYYPLSLSWFSSLFNLNNLKSLVINRSALSGSDEDFRLLACAFPKLEKLVVPPGCDSQGRTLACLFHLSRHCPNLSEIKICLGFDIYKNLAAVNELPHPIPVNPRHPLKKLYIKSDFDEMRLKPTHLVQIAQFLDPLFPQLSHLEAYDSYSNENWIAIQQIFLALGATRTNALQQFGAMSEGKI